MLLFPLEILIPACYSLIYALKERYVSVHSSILCLRNSIDRGVRLATVHGGAESRTQHCDLNNSNNTCFCQAGLDRKLVFSSYNSCYPDALEGN